MAQRSMRFLVRLGAILLVAVGIGMLVMTGLPQRTDYLGVFTGDGYAAPWVGAQAPDFMRRRLDGVPLTLSQQRGKVVLLNFWATWCAPCEAEMPLLQDLHEDYPDLVLWAMNLGEDNRTVAQWIADRGLTFPILLDETQRLEYIYALRGRPSTVIINTDGRIVTIIDGPLHDEVIRPLLDELFVKESVS